MKLRSLFVLLLLPLASIFAQQTERQAYIKEYSQIAVDEMNRSGIPASITLAQAVLESGNGKSELASKSNNHFGIKCHSSWDGAKVYHDDDEKGECFRKYKKVRHSFEDHTDFLVRGARYDFLFELDPYDYQAWAKGLKKAGYATAPDYAERLIKIIEEEQLYLYDKPGQVMASTNTEATQGPTLNAKGKVVTNAKQKFIIHRVTKVKGMPPFVTLLPGERIEYVADSTGLSVKALLAFNDLTYNDAVLPGDRVYLDFKKNTSKEKSILAQQGQTMHQISQAYGVKLEKLYKYNDFAVGQQPDSGQAIRLKPWGLFEKRN